MCGSGPAAVGVQLVLALRRAELGQLLLLQLIGGEALQRLEEGAAGHGRHAQVALHQVAQRARLGQPRRRWSRAGGVRAEV